MNGLNYAAELAYQKISSILDELALRKISGEVAEVGSEVKEFKKGDRILVSCMVPCGEC